MTTRGDYQPGPTEKYEPVAIHSDAGMQALAVPTEDHQKQLQERHPPLKDVPKEFPNLQILDNSTSQAAKKEPNDGPSDTDAATKNQVGGTATTNYESLKGIMNQETIDATMKNEESKRGYKDSIEDWWAKNISSYPNFDVGPAQMSQSQISDLKNDPKYQDKLKDADQFTEDGAKKLIEAYYAREADRFNNNDYARGSDEKFNQDRPGDVGRDGVRKNFNEMQDLWNTAKAEGDTDTMRKVLVESYNAGLRRDQIRQVENQRTGDPNPLNVNTNKWGERKDA